jgi:hypothetical protein
MSYERQMASHTHMYRADGGRQALVQVFLDGGTTALRFDQDAPFATAMAAVVVAKVVGTC